VALSGRSSQERWRPKVDLGFLGSLGIAVLGAIVGLMVGVGLAEVVALTADGLGWAEIPETSHVRRFVRRMDEVIAQLGL
jgi:hypothetical protein